MVVADHACLACSAWGQALLTGGCLRGVAREILTEFAGELGKTGANIAIQRLDHVGNLLAVDGLVMRIGTGPEGRTAFRIEQLQLKGKTRRQPLRFHFVQRVEMPTDDVIPSQIAADSGNRAVVS